MAANPPRAPSTLVNYPHYSARQADSTTNILLLPAAGEQVPWARGHGCSLAHLPARPRGEAHPCLPWKAHMCSVGPLLNKTTSFVKAAQQRPPYVIHGRQCPRCPNPLPTHEGRTAFLHAPPPLRIQTLNHAVG